MTQPTEPTPEESRQSDERRRPPFVLEDPLIRFDARVLDPTTAVRLPGGEAPSTTVYVGDTLLITAEGQDDGRDLLGVLAEVIKASGIPLRPVDRDPFENTDDPEHDRRARLLRMAAERRLPLVFPVQFEPTTDEPTAAVDVWPLLQAIRHAGRPAAGDDRAARLSRSIGLNHLMSSAAVISGNPYTRGMAAIVGNPYTRGMAAISGNPYTRGMASGVASYSAAGSGGRGPVSLVIPPPLRTEGAPAPRVVVLDTGVGVHPWFTAQPVDVGLKVDDASGPLWIGYDPTDAGVMDTDPEGKGAIADPMVGFLASHAGHGTFIAGLLRQACADAAITAIRVMDADGVVPELALTDAMTGLAIVQSDKKFYIDAVVLSLGYYSESGDDVAYTAGLRDLTLALTALGTAVFCAGGNDSTQQRSYPAAFADDPHFDDSEHLPLASVAALNPDGSVALFSNDGDWVNAEAPGANLVSTAPTTAQGGWTQDTLFTGPNETVRATVDPDSFGSGFATWSGTSFAAPVLAGQYLARLVAEKAVRKFDVRRDLMGLGRKTTTP